jgi:AcrR family transcriptional regulator
MSERRNASQRRSEIADAALRVLATQGLGRFTAASLAAEVGVSDAALFRHFASMDEIVLGAIDRAGAILFESFPPAAADPIERLGLFFRHRAEVIASSPGVARVIMSDDLAYAAPAAGVAKVTEFRRKSVGFIRQCLSEAAERGLLAANLPPQAALLVVLGSIMALAQNTTSSGGKASRHALAEQVWAVLERALRG